MSIITNQDYNKGFHDGTKHGVNKTRKAIGEEFLVRLQKLRNERGIGPKTWEKILEALDITKEL